MLATLWILNILLAGAFLMAGAVKLFRSREALLRSGPAMAWTKDFSDGAVKVIGSLEIFGAVGLILPLATGVAPFFTPLAAFGLMVLMVGAMTVHARRGENVGLPLVLGLLAAASAVIGIMALWQV